MSKAILGILVFGMVVIANVGQAASPPWYYNWSLLNSTVGADPCVKLGELQFPNNDQPYFAENPVVLPVNVCSSEKAELLAVFLKPMLGQMVKVEIHASSLVTEKPVTWDLPTLMKNFKRAFAENPYFVQMGRAAFGPTPIFRAEVIQFFCDNIAVPNATCNFVAADAFEGVLKDKVSGFNIIMATTTK
ncbi:MAG: hypothetical protein AABZ06_08855 [Bdellovibrionota bacterium]